MGTPKFAQSKKLSAQLLGKRECSDLIEALDAVRAFLGAGPNPELQFDNFGGYNPQGKGTHIGRSRFWLSKTGAEFLAITP